MKVKEYPELARRIFTEVGNMMLLNYTKNKYFDTYPCLNYDLLDIIPSDLLNTTIKKLKMKDGEREDMVVFLNNYEDLLFRISRLKGLRHSIEISFLKLKKAFKIEPNCFELLKMVIGSGINIEKASLKISNQDSNAPEVEDSFHQIVTSIEDIILLYDVYVTKKDIALFEIFKILIFVHCCGIDLKKIKFNRDSEYIDSTLDKYINKLVEETESKLGNMSSRQMLESEKLNNAKGNIL